MKPLHYLLASLLLLASTSLRSQPIKVGSETYALVIGIAKYLEIDSLQYADDDALAVYEFFRSPSGGSLDDDHVHVLLNENVTNFNMIEELRWLKSKLHRGDNCFIYFSGHGDNDDDTYDKYGFLLTYDTPKGVYMAGAFNISYLQSYVKTFSANGAKVVLVTDACHSGNLAGNSINGTAIAAAALEQQFGDEIKILSCQPNEFSYEDEQWGGGRSVFSWYFVRGLMGLADGNADGKVSVKEIRRYLEDHVPEDVSPEAQNPIVNGPIDFILAEVNPDILAELKKEEETGIMLAMTELNSKGFEDRILEQSDTTTKLNYTLFKQSLKDERLTTPDSDCAYYYYNLLKQDTSISSIYGLLTRNFAAKLQNQSQLFLNRYLKGDSLKMDVYDVKQIANYLQLSADLLGPDHILYTSIKARELFFSGMYEEYSPYMVSQKEAYRKAISFYKKSLELDDHAPHVYNEMGSIYIDLDEIDSAKMLYRNALKYAPRWTYPIFNLGLSFDLTNEADSALFYYQKTVKVDSNYISGWIGMSNIYKDKKDYDLALYYCSKAHEIDTAAGKPYYYLAMIYDDLDSVEIAKDYYIESVSRDYRSEDAIYNLAYMFYIHDEYTRSKNVLEVAVDSKDELNLDADIYNLLSLDYQYLMDTVSRIWALQNALSLDSTHYYANRNMGLHYADIGEYNLSLYYLEKARTKRPDTEDIYEQIAKIEGKAGLYNEQIGTYQSLITFAANPAAYFDSLATSYLMIYDTAGSINQMGLKVAYSKDSLSAMVDWGYWAYALDQGKQSAEILTGILKIDPDNIDALVYLGMNSLYNNGDLPQAKSWFDQLEKLDDGDRYNSWVYDQMAYVYGASGDKERGNKYFKKALKADDADEVNIYYNRACALALQEEFKDALNAIEKSFKAGYTNLTQIYTDPDLATLIELPAFKNLINKYFGD